MSVLFLPFSGCSFDREIAALYRISLATPAARILIGVHAIVCTKGKGPWSGTLSLSLRCVFIQARERKKKKKMPRCSNLRQSDIIIGGIRDWVNSMLLVTTIIND